MKRFAMLSLLVAPAVASANVEIGGTAGLHTFSKEDGLGVDEFTAGEDVNSLANSSLFAIRLGVYFGDKIGVEAEGGLIPTEPRLQTSDVYALVVRGSLVYQLRAEVPTNKILPFVLAGGGILKIVETSDEDIITKEQLPQFHLGVGAKYRAPNNWGVRLDFRGLLNKGSDDKQKLGLEVLGSIYKEFGRKTVAAVKTEEPPKDDDPDKDGISGAADTCPTEPEDMDGFEDTDGCPELDNDKDGIPDATDKCPLEAEDKDGFQDDDGCPDPDNDGDGVPDSADKCSDQPETRNGYQDNDGCPDEIPEQLKKFTGVIQGITFKTGDATLLPASNKTLDKAVAVLKEFGDVKLEIQGHTDDVPLKPTKGSKYTTNEELSQARAESVRTYFVAKGIEDARVLAKGFGPSAPAVDPTGLKGGKLNAARAKNRRVEFKLVSSIDEAAQAPAPAAPETAPEAPKTEDAPKTDAPKQ